MGDPLQFTSSCSAWPRGSPTPAVGPRVAEPISRGNEVTARRHYDGTQEIITGRPRVIATDSILAVRSTRGIKTRNVACRPNTAWLPPAPQDDRNCSMISTR